MKLHRYVSSAVLVMLLLPVETALPQGAQSANPREVVKSFYRFHFSRSMDFTKQNILRRQRWLAPQLYKLLQNEFHREDEYSRSHPNESFVPYMEGDPFTQSQQYPTTFRVDKSVVCGNKANVEIVFLWSAKSSRGRDERNVEIQLTKHNGKWLINNVIDKDSGADLLADLKREKYLP